MNYSNLRIINILLEVFLVRHVLFLIKYTLSFIVFDNCFLFLFLNAYYLIENFTNFLSENWINLFFFRENFFFIANFIGY